MKSPLDPLAQAFSDFGGVVDWSTSPTPPSGARQSPDGRCWAALQGVMYNREELRRALERCDWIERDSPGADLALAGYLAWGPDLLHRLVGDFALALWDGSRQTFLGATDPLGACPLYYTERNGCLLFSSHTAPLHAELGVPDEIDGETVVSYLVRGEDRPDRTFYRHLRCLPGGHFLEARPGLLRVRRYWGPTFHPLPEIRTTEDLTERFVELLHQAVGERLALAPKTGILMSGGFDSTSVAAVAARLVAPELDKLHVFSHLFEGMPCDEGPRIRLALAHLGLEADLFSHQGAALTLAAMQADVRRHDGPRVNLQHDLFEAVRAAAQSWGARVLLTGVGGDELTIDYDYHVDLLRSAGWKGFWPAARKIARIESLSLRQVMVSLARQACPEPIKNVYRRLSHFPKRGNPGVEQWLRPEWRSLALRLQQNKRSGPPPGAVESQTQRARWSLLELPSAQRALSWWARELMPDGIWCCSPFQDRRLFELVLGTPAQLHPRTFDAGEYKPLLSRGVGPLLPPELTGRYWKVEFSSFMTRVLDQTLSQNRTALFDDRPWRSKRFIEKQAALALLIGRQPHLSLQTHGRSGSAHVVGLLERIIGLELWLEAREEKRLPVTEGREPWSDKKGNETQINRSQPEARKSSPIAGHS